jgi:arabinogalactan endo-1,4-beta-galactosidase
MTKPQNIVLLISLVLLAVVVFIMARAYLSRTPAQPVKNSGFDGPSADGIPAGWNISGSKEAVSIQTGGRSGGRYLAYQSDGTYRVETWQTVGNLKEGWYTLRAWVRSGGGQKAARIGMKDCGGGERTADLPVIPADQWVQIVVSGYITGGRCTISLFVDAEAGAWAGFDDVELVPGKAALTILGSDISSLKKSEDKGGVYRSEDGAPGDALNILKDHGLNYARLRVWVDSADGYHGKTELLGMARRLKDAGIKLLVDFHYSDTWADPGKQFKPAAWKDYDFPRLTQAVYDYTLDICTSLKAQGTPPDMVQIGNEINAGMLWPDGNVKNWDNLAALLKEGYRAVKDCSPSTRVMLHLAEGGKNDLARAWFDSARQRKVPFDVIGVSYYPYWHGTLADLQANLFDLAARYGKDLVVAETAYAFTYAENDREKNILQNAVAGYPMTPEGQAALVRDVMSVVRAVPNGRGLGIFYWDATWTAVPGNGWDPANPATGNGWENQALFDYQDRALPAMSAFLNP